MTKLRLLVIILAMCLLSSCNSAVSESNSNSTEQPKSTFINTLAESGENENISNEATVTLTYYSWKTSELIESDEIKATYLEVDERLIADGYYISRDEESGKSKMIYRYVLQNRVPNEIVLDLSSIDASTNEEWITIKEISCYDNIDPIYQYQDNIRLISDGYEITPSEDVNESPKILYKYIIQVKNK